WLDYQARAARIRLLEQRAEKLEQLRQTGNAAPYHMDALIETKKELIKLNRVHRGEHDVLYFAMEYFSEDGNPGNDSNLIPAGVNALNAAEFHRTLCDLLNDVITGRQREHVAWACPRGHAKTAYLSNIFLAH